MSSPCRSAASTIGSCTGTATRRTGGRTCKWRRSRSRRSFGTSALSMLPQQRLATKVCDRGGCYPGWCRWHLRQGAALRQDNEEVQLCAFDCSQRMATICAVFPLSIRTANLVRLLARWPNGIFVALFELGEIGPDPLRAACRMGLEGLVSKHRDRPYEDRGTGSSSSIR